MGLFRKRISVEELVVTLALTCEQSVEAFYEAFSHVHLGGEYASISGEDVYLELWYLARFAVDYGVTHELGQANPQRNTIIDMYAWYILKCSDTNEPTMLTLRLPSDFIERGNVCLEKYTLAFTNPSHRGISAASEAVGIEFAQSLGYARDHFSASGATNCFSKILCDVIDLLRSVKITQD